MMLRYRIYRKESRFYYSFDKETGKRESLETKDRHEALELVQAKNRADREPTLNLHLARTFLAASNPETLSRTWQTVFDEIVKTKTGATQDRWLRASADAEFLISSEVVCRDLHKVSIYKRSMRSIIFLFRCGQVSRCVMDNIHKIAIKRSYVILIHNE